MKGWRFYGFNDMRLDDLPDPVVKPGWIVVKPKVVQPSVTEAALAYGFRSIGYDYVEALFANGKPVQLFGHEFCGEVVEVGQNVSRFKTGDRVVARNRIPCRQCSVCLAGAVDRCRKGPMVGFQLEGCFAEFVALPAEAFVKVPDKITDSEGACIQPLSGAVEAVESADITMGDTVAIIGQGVMGLYCTQVCLVAGAKQVIGIDIHKSNLKLALEFGVSEALDSSVTDPVEAVLEITQGVGADVIIEAAGGSPQLGLAGYVALEQAFKMVRDAGKVIQASHMGEPVNLLLDPLREKSIRYIFPDAATTHLLEYCVSLVATGRVKVSPMVTHILQGIQEVGKAFEITANKQKYAAMNPAQVVFES